MTHQMGVFALMRVAEKLRATADALEAASSQQQVTLIFSRLRYSAQGWHEWSAATEGVTVVDRRDEWRAKFNQASRGGDSRPT